MEMNKIAAAILLAGLIGMITGKVATILYYGAPHHAESHEAKRGYSIEVTEVDASAGGAAKEVELASIIPLLSSADVSAGETIYNKKCATCHTHDKGGKHLTGPNQWEIVNRKKGSAAGFGYSKALAALTDKQWGYDELNGFINNPKKYMPGTIMAFAGIKKDTERANVIAYMRTFSNAPAAIPEAPAPAAEAPKDDIPDKALQPENLHPKQGKTPHGD